MLPDWLAKSVFGSATVDALFKAAGGHKYIRKYRGPGGKWIYIYKEGQGPGRAAAEQAARPPAQQDKAPTPPPVAQPEQKEAQPAKSGVDADLAAAIESGALKGTVEEHRATAEYFLAKHAKALPSSIEKLKGLAGAKAEVQGRTKDVASALGKLVRKPKYEHAARLQDGTGMRVIHGSIDEVKETVNKIKSQYKIIDEDNYIDTPLADYRSHHLIVEDSDGLQKEIQVRTGNQDTFANWSHDVYKPRTPEQNKAVAKARPEIDAYSKSMSDHFFKVDTGGKSTPPPCSPAIKVAVGCIS